MPLPFSNSAVTDYGMPTSPTIGFKNFDGIDKVDPQTDQDATEMNRELSDLSQLTRSCARGFVIFTASASPSLVSSDAMWGNGLAVQPTFTHVGTGHWQITFPATPTDPLGNVGAINLRSAMCGVVGSVLYLSQCQVTSANTIDVYAFTTGFSANDVGANIVVWFN